MTRSHTDLRASFKGKAMPLALLDMMIAGHAVATATILVPCNRTFARVGSLLETGDWTVAGI